MSGVPRFSVAIPTYNRLRTFLPEAIRGVLRQSFADFELIVSDNGSTDGTSDHVRSLADPRVRLVRHQATMPAGEHFAALLREAQGEYVILHQDDDLLHRDFLLRADAAFREFPSAVMYGTPIWRQVHGRGYHSRLMRPRAKRPRRSTTCALRSRWPGKPGAPVQPGACGWPSWCCATA